MSGPLRTTPTRGILREPPPMPPEWTRRAACQYWPELDWIDPAPEQARDCRAVCVDCPVRRECLADALADAEPGGIWGGFDVDERADLARAQGFPPPRLLPAHGMHTRYLRYGCRCGTCRYTHASYERERTRAARLRAARRAESLAT
jgi:WhiB family redox-sensing transcriptional regulator